MNVDSNFLNFSVLHPLYISVDTIMMMDLATMKLPIGF